MDEFNMEELDRKSYRKGVFTGIIPTVLIALVIFLVFFIKGREKYVNLDTDTINKINAVSELIDENFLFETDKDKIQESIIRGYVSGLDDKYSTYYDKEELAELTSNYEGKTSGFGIMVYIEDGSCTIAEVLNGGSAFEEGIMEDDIITEVDGISIKDCTREQISECLKSEPGDVKEITVLRDDVEIRFTLTSREMENIYVYYEMLEDKIAYISITGFNTATINQFKDAVDLMKEEEAESVIFDVRGNPGGTLDSVVNMVDYLLPEGLILYVEDKNGKKKEYNSTNAEANLTIPCVVLTDKNTASAAEVFTGALKDHGYADIVGTKTFGKGIVQSIFSLNDGTAVKLTVEKYYTPSGVCIHGIGIQPTLEVELDADAYQNEGEDTQLNAAIDYILNRR